MAALKLQIETIQHEQSTSNHLKCRGKTDTGEIFCHLHTYSASRLLGQFTRVTISGCTKNLPLNCSYSMYRFCKWMAYLSAIETFSSSVNGHLPKFVSPKNNLKVFF